MIKLNWQVIYIYMQKYHLSDEEYGKVLDNIVVGCVDVAIVYKHKILLERRTIDPIKGSWWIFGGRILKGESLRSTAQRGVARELGLLINDRSRFEFIGVYNLIWENRREPIQNNGCHHLLIAHSLVLTTGEKNAIDKIILQKDNLRWFDKDDTDYFNQELKTIIEKCPFN